jgi:hypothetical protein
VNEIAVPGLTLSRIDPDALVESDRVAVAVARKVPLVEYAWFACVPLALPPSPNDQLTPVTETPGGRSPTVAAKLIDRFATRRAGATMIATWGPTTVID